MHVRCQCRWVRGFITHQRLDRRDQIAIRVMLTDIAVNASLTHFLDQNIAVVNGKNQYLGLWQVSEDLPCGLQAIAFGHAEIQDSHIGLELVRSFYRLLAVSRLGHYLPVGIFFDDCANTSAKDIVVIGYEEANVRHFAPPGKRATWTGVPFFRLGRSRPSVLLMMK